MAGYAISGRLLDLGKLRIGIAIVSSIVNVVAIVVSGPTAFLAANAVTTALGMLVLAWGARRAVRTSFGAAAPLEPGDTDGIVQFTLKSSLATSVQGGSDQVLFAVAGLAGGSTFLARFRVASAPGRFVLAGASPVATVLFPRTTERAARGDAVAVRELQQRASRRIAPFTALIAVAALALMHVALPLAYGTAYRSASFAAALFVVAACIRVLFVWSKVVLLAVGRPGLRIVAVIAESLVLIAVTIVFARADELTGLAGANVVVAVALAVWWFAILRWKDLLVHHSHIEVGQSIPTSELVVDS